ncbi:MAG: UDP-N-acetylmuramoyl-tripeptide--D-alanyl-D-alanine ligase [Clostridia bacterium]|jgi:UDP-N-acetylmuramoyl-tripeptide--D-alanyl-D-alanine ligase|nr:UDP-N-acetylmuramoyl-tripeptide--D-alanyl-D-alanine ligase [Clostridia bacterium]MCI1999623.1 UDP-N-acetylmuramoyl-tripeptide--D-alanyl-D-alanine ligase [Clostridia bacterium]MCI2013998.1 UDP-N-acetylmuramoyl-tripeptide--D-alanyl-D-alanine ligase [Clostridia bacterium]
MNSMTLGEIAEAVNGNFAGNRDIKIDSITTDTRKIKKGCLFIPLKGAKFDGHDFINQAFEKGAVCCLSHKKDVKGNVIYVKDTKKALGDIAKYYRGLFDIKVCGITGSVGKTTTKDMIFSVLSQKYKTIKTQGNFNNDIGLPLTVFNIEDNTEAAVIEMGMNNFGEISYLTRIARPDVAVITNVGVSHIENLGSREGILKAKCEIFEGLSKNGTIILNGDNDMLHTLKGKTQHKTIWFGIKNKDGIYAENINSNGIEGVKCTICAYGKKFDVNINVPGDHMVLNALAAAAVGFEFGLNFKEIKAGIESFVPTGMRMEISKTKNNITVINDAYNANPVSMKAAIDVLCKAEGRKTAVLGDMFELGDFGPKLHFEVGEYAAEKGIDEIICIGSISKNIYDGVLSKNGHAVYFEDTESFFKNGFELLNISDSTVLVKASHSMQFEKIAERIAEVN